MCNLSTGLVNKGRAEGRAKEKIRTVINAHRSNISLSVIGDITGLTEKEIPAILKANGCEVQFTEVIVYRFFNFM